MKPVRPAWSRPQRLREVVARVLPGRHASTSPDLVDAMPTPAGQVAEAARARTATASPASPEDLTRTAARPAGGDQIKHLTPGRVPVPQPAIALRARRHLRMITAGLACALTGVLGTVGASVSLLRLTDGGRLWPAVGNAAACLVAIFALLQWRLWHLALREWEGRRDVGLGAWLNVSRTAVWVSALAAGAVALAAQHVMADSTPSEPAWWLAALGAVASIMGASLAGAHRLHLNGPRGVPPRIRRNHHRRDERLQQVLATRQAQLEDLRETARVSRRKRPEASRPAGGASDEQDAPQPAAPVAEDGQPDQE